MKKYILGVLMVFAMTGLGFASQAFAQTATGASPGWGPRGGMHGGTGMVRPAVVGTVSAINGDILTVTGKQFVKSTITGTPPTSTTVIYTVDATNATVTKASVASTVSAIAIGDSVAVQGTVSGTNVTATSIHDGVMGRGFGVDKSGGSQNSGNASGGVANLVAGNGQPVIGGAITVISGNTLTITNKSNVTYTIDVTNSKFLQGSTTITISGLKVGDQVVVQGAVSGNSVTASTVIDQSKPATGSTTTPHKSFFGGIGQFFAHLFGF